MSVVLNSLGVLEEHRDDAECARRRQDAATARLLRTLDVRKAEAELDLGRGNGIVELKAEEGSNGEE